MKKFLRRYIKSDVVQLVMIWLGAYCLLMLWAQVDQGQDSIDAKVTLFFSGNRYSWLTTFMKKVTLLGDWIGAVAAIGLAGLILYSKNFPKRTIGILTTSIAASALLGFCISQLLKASTARPRPLDRLIEIDSFAYPSGHATTAFALYFCSALLFSRLPGSRQKHWMLIAGGYRRMSYCIKQTISRCSLAQ